jgi:hypothetical protein
MPEGYITGWLVFGLVMPAIVAGLGWLAVLHHERYLRNRRPLADPSLMEDRAQSGHQEREDLNAWK